MAEHTFDFAPNFQKIEDFMRLYQELHSQAQEACIKLTVTPAFIKAVVGFPDIEQNCWITLRHAVDQMNRAFLNEKSKVRIVVLNGGLQ